MTGFPKLLAAALAACVLAACSGGATVGPAAAGGSSGGSPRPGPPVAPSAAPSWAATPSPAPTTSSGATTIDRTCDLAPYPSAQWTQCEAALNAMTREAPQEQTASAFAQRWQAQSQTNIAEWTARLSADPSWLSPLSGDTTLTPLCSTLGEQCVGDPFRYADTPGPDGADFFNGQGTFVPFVFYDDGCARLSGHVWAPASSASGSRLPGIVVDNGSVQGVEPMYRWAAQALVRAGYVVMTFDPRGEGRSDFQTPSGAQGNNANYQIFWTGLVNAIDFFRSTPSHPYPWNVTCKGTYPTVVANYNPYWDRIDFNRLGIVGHSYGAVGVSVVQGLGGPGTAPWPGKIDPSNPVKAAVMWDGLMSPSGGDVGAIGDASGLEPTTPFPKYAVRVPSMGQSSEYGQEPVPFTSPPPAELHKDGYRGWVTAAQPVFEFTIQGSSHWEFSTVPNLPATSWCPNPSTNQCAGGWGNPMSAYYTVAWFDRWLKQPGESGYADADTRLLSDNGPQGRVKMSYRFRSARNFPDRNGVQHHCEDIRAGCSDAAFATRRR